MKDGRMFESMVKKHFGIISPKGCYLPTTEFEDKVNGTDCYLYKIPVDITMDISQKDNVGYIGTYEVCGAYPISLGIRRKNSSGHVFPTPVLVLGFNFYTDDVREARLLIQMISKEDLLNMLDMYIDVIDPVEEEEDTNDNVNTTGIA